MPAGLLVFVCNDTATTEIYTLSLHDALPISRAGIPQWYLNRRKNMDDGSNNHMITSDLDFAASTAIEREKLDRKSTRLNSSHANISYAVFCLNHLVQPLTSISALPLVPLDLT